MKLSGKSVIVTGGSRGIGRATVFSLAGEGAKVALMARSKEDIDEVVSKIGAEGGCAISLAGDLRKDEDVRLCVEEVLRAFGGIDILVNNAGVITPMGPIWKLAVGDWDSALATNLRGPFLMTRYAVPAMIGRRKGKIINIASGMGERPFANFSAYCASKAALIMMTKVMALELKPYGIDVNGVEPGVVDTAMAEAILDVGPESAGLDFYLNMKRLKESEELMKPEDVARIVLFLASDAADGIWGQCGNARLYTSLGFKP